MWKNVGCRKLRCELFYLDGNSRRVLAERRTQRTLPAVARHGHNRSVPRNEMKSAIITTPQHRMPRRRPHVQCPPAVVSQRDTFYQHQNKNYIISIYIYISQSTGLVEHHTAPTWLPPVDCRTTTTTTQQQLQQQKQQQQFRSRRNSSTNGVRLVCRTAWPPRGRAKSSRPLENNQHFIRFSARVPSSLAGAFQDAFPGADDVLRLQRTRI